MFEDARLHGDPWGGVMSAQHNKAVAEQIFTKWHEFTVLHHKRKKAIKTRMKQVRFTAKVRETAAKSKIVKAQMSEEMDNRELLRLANVEDVGCGISDDELERRSVATPKYRI